MKYRYIHILPFLLFLLIPGFGEVSFSELNLSESGPLLFRAGVSSSPSGEYSTLFRADLDTKELDQLTFFPEKAVLINGGERFQVQNRFGLFRTDENLRNMQPVRTFPAFVNGHEIQTGKINTVGSSPDGRFLLYLKPQSHGYADLMLYHIGREREYRIADRVEMTLDGPNASWSPDSRYFVYNKGGSLYYYAMDQLLGERVISESFRVLGKGKLSSIRWSRQNDLYYVTGNLVYQILSPEFFTRSIYSGLFDVGHIAGKIPFEFDPAFDSFWIAPDGSKILLNKGGQNILLYILQPDDYLSTGDTTSLPYLYLPRNTVVKRVLWSGVGIITLLTDSIVEGSDRSQLFRLNLSTGESRFSPVEREGLRDLVLSPDQESCALLFDGRVEIYNYYSFRLERSLDYYRPLHVLWRSNQELIIAGARASVLYSRKESREELISLSQHDRAGFTPEGKVLLQLGTEYWIEKEGRWVRTDRTETLPAVLAGSKFRVYLERHAGGSYRNMVMVRDLDRLITTPLFRYPEKRYDPYPERDEEISMSNFSHGTRIRRRELSLVFNAIDSVEGLTSVLHTLRDYGIRATFFVNGEFIRRHPDAVKEIAQSGHEVGSLFYAYFNMTDSRFEVDKDFIKRGLARNEDDYFKATGSELSLLWHAPYYFINSEIIAASQEMNYTYVSRDVDPLDWIAPGSGVRSADLYMPAADILERVLKQKKPGSIIPLRIGKTQPEREDYLFHSLDILIDELISLGYTIVPVTQLIEHAE
jgi:peptidoglycan/xylan/chitin deacetylase (PgdA/CDA1 family)